MNAVSVVPYCPFPIDSGAKSIIAKHLQFLNKEGKCRILSLKHKPVGGGWNEKIIKELQESGYAVEFDNRRILNCLPLAYGLAYATFFKILKAERAFGHSNPYHRFAFTSQWLSAMSRDCDLCEIHYSYWAGLKTNCPKVVIMHDIWSDIMWEGDKVENRELHSADLLVTVSQDDKLKLEKKGHVNVHWSPPCIDSLELDDSVEVGVVGSGNRHNVEGLEWLLSGVELYFPKRVHCYGGLGKIVAGDERFVTRSRYGDTYDPYRECGILLMLTTGGTGLQIKGVEALACGRAIIARKGAMRGLPTEARGWIEVETREEMFDAIDKLCKDKKARKELSERAKAYYMQHLEKNEILRKLKVEYQKLIV